MSRRMRRSALLATALLAALAPVPVHAADTTVTTAACDRDTTVSVDNLHVSVDPTADVVRVGQRARFEVVVSRPGSGRPGGLGPGLDLPARVPAAGVRAAVWLPLEPTPAAALAETDDQGRALVEIPIPTSTRAGTIDVRGFAWNTIISGCLTLEEVGQVDIPDALTVKAPRRA
ncbi:MAG TPA: hypothetical protein VGB51_04350 [Actinomycetota bacterium]